ncbi:MAG: hypothetical protein LUD69_00375, partial [Oscillospiraceae bacterium]|nr:hypothetical protein [Oscillospiraceae bacterium]
ARAYPLRVILHATVTRPAQLAGLRYKCAPGTFASRCGFKLLQRTFDGKVPPAAADAFNQSFLNLKEVSVDSNYFLQRKKI